jgi:hypothetical protein
MHLLSQIIYSCKTVYMFLSVLARSIKGRVFGSFMELLMKGYLKNLVAYTFLNVTVWPGQNIFYLKLRHHVMDCRV